MKKLFLVLLFLFALSHEASASIKAASTTPNVTSVTGILPVANGGTGVTSTAIYNVQASPYNAYGDWTQVYSSGTITAGTNAFHSTAVTFTTSDVGKQIVIWGAGTNGNALSTTISGYVGANDIILAANAATTTSASVYNAHVAGIGTSHNEWLWVTHWRACSGL